MQRTEEQKKLFRKKLAEAPEQLADYLGSEEVSSAIRSIGERNGLHIDTLGTLAYLIGDALVGVFPPTELKERLQKHLNLDDSASTKMLEEIEKEIFAPARAIMKEGQKPDEAPSDTETSPEAVVRKVDEIDTTQKEGAEDMPHESKPKMEEEHTQESQEKEGAEHSKLETAQAKEVEKKSQHQVDPYREPIDD